MFDFDDLEAAENEQKLRSAWTQDDASKQAQQLGAADAPAGQTDAMITEEGAQRGDIKTEYVAETPDDLEQPEQDGTAFDKMAEGECHPHGMQVDLEDAPTNSDIAMTSDDGEGPSESSLNELD